MNRVVLLIGKGKITRGDVQKTSKRCYGGRVFGSRKSGESHVKEKNVKGCRTKGLDCVRMPKPRQ